MKFVITYTDDRGYKKTRIEEIETIEQLLEIIKKENEPIIISENIIQLYPGAKWMIEIYNDYRE